MPRKGQEKGEQAYQKRKGCKEGDLFKILLFQIFKTQQSDDPVG